MTRKAPFGRRMRDAHFSFSPSYTPLNHGSFGAFPRLVAEQQNELQRLAAERPDTFIVADLPNLIDESREAVAPLLGVPVDEVVFVPNATTGINTVLRNLKWEVGDVIVHFSTIYGACEKTIASIGEMTPLVPRSILLEYPVEDADILQKFREMVKKVRGEGRNVRMAMFDTVLTFPGARMPWEELVAACKELGVLSLIDGAHGIGHIDLTHLGSVGPDFFHLIRTCLPTSHGYHFPGEVPDPNEKSPFVHLFEFVATIDYTPYVCVPAAIAFRKDFCGGEASIRNYCWWLARVGGNRVAEILGTSTMNNATKTLINCCFSNIELPLAFKRDGSQRQQGEFDIDEASKIQRWLNATAVKEFDTYLQIAFHAGIMWVRLSGQIYLELNDFEWVGCKLKDLCDRLTGGEIKL
ncbi:Hercynylcysteine sulfoxide lyase [Lachnellula occidentalis]|uniref:Hercynylcysteine sulfoxide lyase n=1 Tax=Lachnellula occidentalis TaxID=215460 RepID=A0A8H8U713_9HELO|nr:Hercynylcysteine sulfoxide lyase [Lachnellula occidentalis]